MESERYTVRVELFHHLSQTGDGDHRCIQITFSQASRWLIHLPSCPKLWGKGRTEVSSHQMSRDLRRIRWRFRPQCQMWTPGGDVALQFLIHVYGVLRLMSAFVFTLLKWMILLLCQCNRDVRTEVSALFPWMIRSFCVTHWATFGTVFAVSTVQCGWTTFPLLQFCYSHKNIKRNHPFNILYQYYASIHPIGIK